MKILLILFFALGFSGLVIYAVRKPIVEKISIQAGEPVQSEFTPAQKKQAMKNKTPVVVELFTSEGCLSCPPADKNLIYLDEKQPVDGAEIIALELHVDYWNRLGWTDPFSDAEYSERQADYSRNFNLDGVYTPQIVVDGSKQFVGGDLSQAEKTISEASSTPKAAIELSILENGKLQVKIPQLPKLASPAKVFLAVAEDRLSTAVGRGENGGRTLHHAAVVRELKTIGQIAAGSDNFVTEAAFQMRPAWKKENLKLVVFVQDEQTSHIVGANQIRV